MPQYSDDLFLGPAQTYMGTGLRPYTTTATGGTGGAEGGTGGTDGGTAGGSVGILGGTGIGGGVEFAKLKSHQVGHKIDEIKVNK